MLKIKKPKYILYSSPTFSFDNLNTQKRLKYVNEYIIKNVNEIYKTIELEIVK